MNYTLIFRRYAPFETFGGGFEGDCRTAASTCLTDTARTTGVIGFSPGRVGALTAGSSGTAFNLFGATVANLLGKHVSKVTSSVSVSTVSVDLVRFTARTAGANPMIPFAPAIDTFVDIDAVFRDQALEISGSVRGDDFPNAEVFVIDGSGKSALLFAFTTDGGQHTGPMTRLAGDHSNLLLGSFRSVIPRDAHGAFR